MASLKACKKFVKAVKITIQTSFEILLYWRKNLRGGITAIFISNHLNPFGKLRTVVDGSSWQAAACLNLAEGKKMLRFRKTSKYANFFAMQNMDLVLTYQILRFFSY